MARACFDTSLARNPHFHGLGGRIKTLLMMICLFEEAKDGEYTDQEWKSYLHMRSTWEPFVNSLLEWGWLRRNENGNLVRAGILNPFTLDARDRRHNKNGEPHPGREDAAIADLQRKVEELTGLVQQLAGVTNPLQIADKTPTEPLQTVDKSPLKASNSTLPHVRATDSESESDSESDPILLCIKEKSESDSDSDSESAARALCAEFGMETLFDKLRGEHFGVDIVLEVIGTSYNHFRDRGETRTARKMENYCRRGCINLVKDRAKEAETERNANKRFDDMLEGVVPGGMANGAPAQPKGERASPPRPAINPNPEPIPEQVKSQFAAVRRAASAR